jgi:prepilin-type N-terminal cleavage/methylation domain-containing protein
MEMQEHSNKEREHGFTLIELLVAIVVVGILTAVAIVGINGLTDTAKAATCQTTLDAARAASASYYAKQSPNAYPTTFKQMIDDNDLVLQGGVQNPSDGATLTDNSSPAKWTITLGAGGVMTASGTASTNCT